MSKEFDHASDLEMQERERAEQLAREAAANIPAGEPGECDYCGYFKQRLVRGACGKCRDDFNLP